MSSNTGNKEPGSLVQPQTVYKCLNCQSILTEIGNHYDMPEWIHEGALVINSTAGGLQVVIENSSCRGLVKTRDADCSREYKVELFRLAEPSNEAVENMRFKVCQRVDAAEKELSYYKVKLELLDEIIEAEKK